jgi:tRNA(Ile)-lysidine synthase
MQIKEILSGLENVGNMYFSSDYKLLVDREYLLLSDRITNPELGQLELNDILTNERSTNPYIEVIDKSKARYGFSLRVPEPGTRMQPLGMNGRSKKISDILIDKKINRFDKGKIQLLYCGDTPVWLIGITLDERFKTDSETTKYLQLTYSTK